MFREDDFRKENTGNEFEYQNRTGQNPEAPDANRPVRVLTASSIIGDNVENLQGEKLGEIKDIMMNIYTGCSEYVVLEYGGVLGVGAKYFAIPFQAFSLNAEKKVFVLDRSKEFLEKAPGFDKDHWPETNSRHYDDVNGYWNY